MYSFGHSGNYLTTTSRHPGYYLTDEQQAKDVDLTTSHAVEKCILTEEHRKTLSTTLKKQKIEMNSTNILKLGHNQATTVAINEFIYHLNDIYLI